MGMFDKEEQTLFKPAPTRAPTSDAPPAQNYRGGGGGGGGDDDDERASLGEMLLFAMNSARRRKLLSFIVTLICLGVTVAAVKLAPRTYVSAGAVLVSKGKEEGAGWNPDGNKREQTEWERQILARSNIENIIKDAKLVERWKEVSDEVCSRLAQAFAEYFPSLHLNVETRRLEFAPGRQNHCNQALAGSPGNPGEIPQACTGIDDQRIGA